MTFRTGELAPNFTATLLNGETVELSEMTKTQSVCIIFLRFMGCPLTRLRLAELQSEINRFNDKELRLLVVFESTVDRTQKYTTRKGLQLDIIPDITRQLYNKFDVRSGSIVSMLNPNVLKKAGEATLKGHMHGAFEGNELQLPAAFIINTSQTFSYVNYGIHPADAVETDKIFESHIELSPETSNTKITA